MKRILFLVIVLSYMGILFCIEPGFITIKGSLATISNDEQGNLYYGLWDFDNNQINFYKADEQFNQIIPIADFKFSEMIYLVKIKKIDKDSLYIELDMRIDGEKGLYQLKTEQKRFRTYGMDDIKEIKENIKNPFKTKELSAIFDCHKKVITSSEKYEVMQKNPHFYKKILYLENHYAIIDTARINSNLCRENIRIFNRKEKLIKSLKFEHTMTNVDRLSYFSSADRIYILLSYSTLCNNANYYRIYAFDYNGKSVFSGLADPRIKMIYDSVQNDNLIFLEGFLDSLANQCQAISEEEYSRLSEETKKVYLLYEKMLNENLYEYEFLPVKKGEYRPLLKGKFKIIRYDLSYNVGKDLGFFYSGSDCLKITVKNAKPRVITTKKVIYMDDDNDFILTQALPIEKRELYHRLFNTATHWIGYSICSNGWFIFNLYNDMTEAKVRFSKDDVVFIKDFYWDKDHWEEKIRKGPEK